MINNNLQFYIQLFRKWVVPAFSLWQSTDTSKENKQKTNKQKQNKKQTKSKNGTEKHTQPSQKNLPQKLQQNNKGEQVHG